MEMNRSATSALGGVSNSERLALQEHNQLWQQRHFRTMPIEKALIVPAIEGLYRSAGLAVPRIIIVPSPGVLAFAGTFASAIWEARATNPAYLLQAEQFAEHVLDFSGDSLLDATCKATLAAITPPISRSAAETVSEGDAYRLTMDATYSKADLATANATDRTTHSDVYSVVDDLVDLKNAVNDAMRDPFGNSSPTPLISNSILHWGQAAANAIFPLRQDSESALNRVGDWFRYAHSGNAGAYWDYRISVYRDVLGLRLPEHADYAYWEQCAIHGSYRYMHAQFCLLSDFPCEISEKNYESIAIGTGLKTYRWRDGWTL